MGKEIELKEIDLAIDDLLLDPNNPRFIKDLTAFSVVPDEELEPKQEETFQRFTRTSSHKDSEGDTTYIGELYDSMRRIGYVGIDRIVVRKISGSKKYLVLEGNRRVATIKKLLSDFENKIPPLKKTEDREEIEPHLPSLRSIRALILETDELSDEEVQRRIATILGIRHHGSLLAWGPLSRAFNIYTEYMGDLKEPTFRWENQQSQNVADRLCIEKTEVNSALRTYVAYRQLREHFDDVQDEYFSLIEAGIKDKFLKAAYFMVDPSTFRLDEPSLTKFNEICQFSTRKSGNSELTTNGKKKIIPEPKDFGLLGKLIDRMQDPDLKDYAADLLRRVEDEDNHEMSVDQAVSAITDFAKRTKWIEYVTKLINKQKEQLDFEKYSGEGADRMYKDQLKTRLRPLKRLLGI